MLFLVVVLETAVLELGPTAAKTGKINGKGVSSTCGFKQNVLPNMSCILPDELCVVPDSWAALISRPFEKH